MTKWKVALFMLATIVVALSISVGADALYGYVSVSGNEPQRADSSVVSFCAENEYIGNMIYDEDGILKRAFNVRDALGLTSENALKITVKGVLCDDFVDFKDVSVDEVTVVADGKEIILVDGVNVFSAKDFSFCLSPYRYLSHDVVLRGDVDLNELSNGTDDKTYYTEYDVYGNGKRIVAAKPLNGNNKYFGTSLELRGYGQKVVDTRFTGRVISDGEILTLDDFLYYGVPVRVGNAERTAKTNATFTNCVFENSYRNVSVAKADVKFVRCFFNNAAESNVSLKTTTGNNSTLTLENCILANAATACVTNVCSEEVDESSYCTINVVGTEFYGWKSSENVKIAVEDGNGDYYKTLNSLLASVVNTADAKEYLVKYKGKYYVSAAIAVVSTKSGVKNVATINGLSENGLRKIKFPSNGPLALLLSRVEIFGYGDLSNIKPDDTPQFSF